MGYIKVRIPNPSATRPVDAPELTNDYDSIAEAQVWINYLMKRGGPAAATQENVVGLSRALTVAINGRRPTKQWITIAKLRQDPKMIKRVFTRVGAGKGVAEDTGTFEEIAEDDDEDYIEEIKSPV